MTTRSHSGSVAHSGSGASRRISRLLIANRGEIACRIIRTAREMGIETVAVYSAGDANAPHARLADRAEALPGRSAADSYLSVDSLLAAARSSGADAVHPGYGFLSERAAFATAVTDAGLVWVGPPPAAIESMGDKLAAKKIMDAAGVPILRSVEVGEPAPGSSGSGSGSGSADKGLTSLDVGGWPVLVKAAAGGGGKGMRIVEKPSELPDAVAAARREAAAAFGDPTVFVERYVGGARHVEIQVLADNHGNVVHCFERDCSVQRRHQKVLEEAPSPAVTASLRAEMGAAAVAAARAVDYRGAGTVEFVVDDKGGFFFLEVNTRLQVEHPVTEAVCGVDLVREQLRIAAGQPISFQQEELELNGHAVEARLYAEDPSAGFLPATGTLIDWTPPDAPSLRWDSGVETRSEIDVEFDPMLAKVIAHAPTREEAVSRLALGLRRARIRGVTTNRDFLVAALTHPEFWSGRATTSFVETSEVALSRPVDPAELRVAAIGAALAADAERRLRGPELLTSGWRNSVMPPERVSFRMAGADSDDDVEVAYAPRRDGTFHVTVGGWSGAVSVLAWDGSELVLEIAGGQQTLDVCRHNDEVWVQGPDGDVRIRQLPRFPDSSAEENPGDLVAPMPGTVVTVEVVSGDQVEQGQLLLILEAMKMEHRIVAPHNGVVSELHAKTGQQVASGDTLLVLTEAETAT